MAEAKNNQTPDVSEQDKIRRGKLADLQAAGNDPFLITKYNVTHHSMEIKNNFDELEGQEVTVAGRMMQKRVMGKASFCNVRDLQGDIQSYVAEMNWVQRPIRHSRSLISVISLASRAKFSRQRQVRFLFMQQRSRSFPRVCIHFLRSSMA